jgi:hypothetical protein
MKTKIAIASIVAAAAALLPVASASADTYWTWTPKHAAAQVAGSTLTWANDADDYVTYAKCRGIGQPHYNNGTRQYYRLNCYVETADGEAYVIRIKADGEHVFKYRFLRPA